MTHEVIGRPGASVFNPAVVHAWVEAEGHKGDEIYRAFCRSSLWVRAGAITWKEKVTCANCLRRSAFIDKGKGRGLG